MVKIFGGLFLLCVFLPLLKATDDNQKGLTFRGSWSGTSQLFLKDAVTLTCEYDGHPPSSLSIFMKNSTQRLPAQVENNALIYRIASLQCKDMGTYICQHESNKDENSTLDVPVKYCAPQLCPGELQAPDRTIYAQLNRNFTLSICLISHATPSLQNIYLNNFRRTLSITGYTYQVARPYGHSSNLYHRVEVDIFRIKQEDYGIVGFRFHSGSGYTDYQFVMKETGFSITVEGIHDGHFHTNEPFSLTCKSAEYPATAMSLFLKNSETPLLTEILDNSALLYQVRRLQCADMGTYVCLYNKNPEQKELVEVPVEGCPPHLCPGKNQKETIYAHLNANITISYCFIANEQFQLGHVYLAGDTTSALPEHRYAHKVSKQKGHDLYYTADIWIYNIQKDDYGSITFRFEHDSENMDYIVVLKEIGMSFKPTIPLAIPVKTGQNISFTCESSDHPPSSLSIQLHGSSNNLQTSPQGNSLTYSISQLQCKDMGTYLCQDSDAPVQKAIDVPIDDCGPQLCPDETQDHPLLAAPLDNVTFSICIIAQKASADLDLDLELDSIVAGENMTSLAPDRYQYSVSTELGRELYHNVSVELYHIQEEDFGIVSFTFMKSNDKILEYRINLIQTEESKQKVNNVVNSTLVAPTTTPNATTRPRTLVGSSGGTTAIAIVIVVAVASVAVIVIVVGVVCLFRAYMKTSKMDVADSKTSKATENGIATPLNENADNGGVILQQYRISLHEDQIPLTSDLFDKDSGRYTSDEGLTYITTDHLKRVSNFTGESNPYVLPMDVDMRHLDGDNRVDDDLRLSEILNKEYVNGGPAL